MSIQIAIELPNDFVAFQSQGQIQRDISLSYAVWLFKNEQVTIAKAAKLAGLNIYEFIAACKANQVPVINISREELLDELEAISSR